MHRPILLALHRRRTRQGRARHRNQSPWFSLRSRLFARTGEVCRSEPDRQETESHSALTHLEGRLEIDLALFRRAQTRSILLGLLTTAIPLMLGTTVGFLFGYRLIPAAVLGSLLASHTLLGAPIVARLGETRLEPITITVGATIVSDTLSLVVFAICVSTYEKGFSISGLTVQLLEIAIFVPFTLFGLSRLGGYLLKKVEKDENAYFVLMLAMLAVAGLLATLPQVAATLAATLVAFNTFDPVGQRLLDSQLLNVVLVLMLTTSILGPVLTERFAPRLLAEDSAPAPESHRAA